MIRFNRGIKLVVLSSALLSALFLTACHTVSGAGQDIEAGGNAIQKAANK